jgi:hypothetical protein
MLIWKAYGETVQLQLDDVRRKDVGENEHQGPGLETDMRDLLLESTILYNEDWDRIAVAVGTSKSASRASYKKYLRQLSKNNEWSSAEDDLLERVCMDNVWSNIVGAGEGLAGDEYVDTLYGQAVQWRNVSYVMNRPSIDCRKRYYLTQFGRDVIRGQDIWHFSEVCHLNSLVSDIIARNRDRGLAETYPAAGTIVNGSKIYWSEIGRDLGRTRQQCYICYQNHRKVFEHTESGEKLSEGTKEMYDQVHDGLTEHRVGRTSIPMAYSRGLHWESDRDTQLLALHEIHGNQWTKIGSIMGLSAMQCFQRYRIISTKQLPHHKFGWTDLENRELAELVAKHGKKWTLIGKQLGRSAYVCQHAYIRFSLKQKKMSMDAEGEVDGSSSDKLGSLHEETPVKMDKIRDNDVYKDSLPKIAYTHESVDRLVDNVDILGNAKHSQHHSHSPQLWTKADDERLKALVHSMGRRFGPIAEIVGRSPEDVMLRYEFKIAPKRTGCWTKTEDERFLKLYSEMGPRWAAIGEKIGRSGPQCFNRYTHMHMCTRIPSFLVCRQKLTLRNTTGHHDIIHTRAYVRVYICIYVCICDVYLQV